MIYVAINTKGGVGKSTFSNQILPAYLYQKNNAATRLIEIDDQNEDSKILSASEIIDAKIIHTSKLKELDEIFLDDEDFIIDIGGNITGKIFLDEMAKSNKDEIENITWFVPVGAGSQDAANALDTYNEIKALGKNAKIIFVLSNVRDASDLHWEFLHFFGNEFLDTDFAIPEHIKEYSYILVKNSDIVNNAKTFNKTVYDLAQNDTDFKAAAKQAKADSDDFLKRKYLFLNRVRNEAVAYIDDMKNGLFKELDKLLK
jgi:hypothetical protein